MTNVRFASATLVAAAVASAASAQLVFGTTTNVSGSGNPTAIYMDVNTQQTTTLWSLTTNKKVNGIANDSVHGRIYANDAARLNVWSYGQVGTAPAFIAGMYRTDGVTFTATGVDGLTFANNTLYATTSFGSTVFKRGIYTVNTTPDGASTPHCVMTPLWLDPTGVGTNSGTLQFGDLEYNPADNKFWVVNGTDTTGTGGTYQRAIYTVDVFGSGAMTKIADFPVGHTQIDGITIGGGKVWLTEQEPGSSRVNIFPYNPTTNAYETTITFALTDPTQRASDATWVPTPGAASLLGIAGLAGLRRRRA